MHGLCRKAPGIILGKVCTSRQIKGWREYKRRIGSVVVDFLCKLAFIARIPGEFPDFGRTHAAPHKMRCLRAIHRLESANSVVSCAVFFFNPR